MAAKKTELVFDTDNPEWTEADFAKARSADEILPPLFMASFQRKLQKRQGIDHE